MVSPDDIDLSDISGDIETPGYFVFGKTRIKITEHFAADGKPLVDLMDEFLQSKVRQEVRKTA